MSYFLLYILSSLIMYLIYYAGERAMGNMSDFEEHRVEWLIISLVPLLNLIAAVGFLSYLICRVLGSLGKIKVF